MTRVGLSLVLLTVVGCKKLDNKIEEITEDAGITVPPVQVPPVQVPAFSLPKSSSGAYQLIKVAGSKLEIDPTLSDPITAVGRCADLVTTCYEGGGTLDACIQQTRRCATNEPWKERDDCCPSACADGYAQTRAQGVAPTEAFESVFFVKAECFPGVVEAIGGAP